MKNVLHTVKDTVLSLLPGNNGSRRLRLFALVQVIWGMQCIDGGKNVLWQTKQRIASQHLLCHRVTVFEDLRALEAAGHVQRLKPFRRNSSPLPPGVAPDREAHMREHGWSELTLSGGLKELFKHAQADARLAEESGKNRQQTLRSPKQQYAIQQAIADREAGRPRYSAPVPEQPVRTPARPQDFGPSESLRPIQPPPAELHDRIANLGRAIAWDNEPKPPS